MSYLTALNFFLMGLGLLLMERKERRGPRPGQFFTLTAIMVCLLAVIGYIVHMGVFYGETSLFPGTRMHRDTTLCFLLLGTGILCARPEGSLMRVLTSRTDGGFILRRLLLLPVAVPLAVGTDSPHPALFTFDEPADRLVAVFLRGHSGFHPDFLVERARCSTAMDLKRQAAADELKALNSELERRVEQRTGQVLEANRELKEEVAERRHRGGRSAQIEREPRTAGHRPDGANQHGVQGIGNLFLFRLARSARAAPGDRRLFRPGAGGKPCVAGAKPQLSPVRAAQRGKDAAAD